MLLKIKTLIGLLFITTCVSCVKQAHPIIELKPLVNSLPVANFETGLEVDLSPDAKIAVYVDEYRRNIMSYSLDTGNYTTMISVNDGWEVNAPLWSPDGTKLRYSISQVDGSCSVNCSQSMVYDVATDHIEEIPLPFYGVTWSNMGRNILGYNLDDGTIAIMDVISKQLVYRSKIPIKFNTPFPMGIISASLNGKYVVYPAGTTETPDQARIISLVEPFTSEIVIDLGQSGHYLWSPDSQKLAYFRIEQARTRPVVFALQVMIYSFDTDTSELLATIPLSNERFIWPTWSPNGQQIILAANVENDSQNRLQPYPLVFIDTTTGEWNIYEIEGMPEEIGWLKWIDNKLYICGEQYINSRSMGVDILEIVLAGE